MLCTVVSFTGSSWTTFMPPACATSTKVLRSTKSPAPTESHDRSENTGAANPDPRHTPGYRKCPSLAMIREGDRWWDLRPPGLRSDATVARSTGSTAMSTSVTVNLTLSGETGSLMAPSPLGSSEVPLAFSRTSDCDDAPPPVPVDRPGDESLDSPIHPRGATIRSVPFSMASPARVAPFSAYLYRTGRSSGATSKSSHHVRVPSSRFITGARSRSHPPSAAQSPVAVKR
mmetsp:Transcript_11457/g.53253  ORF Transcript_11457/g.53253 Transcript_11457/m.53253 type:complete len:230 (+) Transcript_11457:4020-4709(+)